MMKMTKIQLQEAIRARGEEPPKEWSNVELRDRLTELMEMHGESVGGSRKTDLRQWMTELNKCSRKKELLRNFCEERLKITLDGNETIPVLQKKATKVIYEVSVANAMDPVGFGKWSTLSYGQLRREQPSYANWVQETLLEGGNTCDYRLSRLGNWLMNQPDEEIEEANTETKMATTATKSTTIANYPMSKAKGKSGKGRGKPTLEAAYDARSSAPAAPSTTEEPRINNDQLKILMDTMTAMKEEIKQLREDQKSEEPRRKKKDETGAAPSEPSYTMVLDP